MTDKRARKAFTGWHMTAILVAFFGTVVAVNFTMAGLAMSTFGGKVVENSYVASQQYNKLLARAEAQDRLGWVPSITRDRDRRVRIDIRKDGKPLAGLRVGAAASHPLGRTPPLALRFVAAEDGGWRSVEPLAEGRQRLDITIARGADEARYRIDLQ